MLLVSWMVDASNFQTIITPETYAHGAHIALDPLIRLAARGSLPTPRNSSACPRSPTRDLRHWAVPSLENAAMFSHAVLLEGSPALDSNGTEPSLGPVHDVSPRPKAEFGGVPCERHGNLCRRPFFARAKRGRAGCSGNRAREEPLHAVSSFCSTSCCLARARRTHRWRKGSRLLSLPRVGCRSREHCWRIPRR